MAERKRIVVPISGIDTSAPDHSVTDGKCSTLHNLRYTGGAWRNVNDFLRRTIPSTLQADKILYVHPTNGQLNFITKTTTTKESTKIRYYGCRSQAQAIEELGSESIQTTNTTNNLTADSSPISGILRPFSTTYYLNAPLSVARKHPLGVELYDDELLKLGDVVGFANGELKYIPDNASLEDGYLKLYYSAASYSKLGKAYTENFYFITDTITENGRVFIKRGNNYIYFGVVTSTDSTNKVYAIREATSGVNIACHINSLTSVHIKFEKYISSGESKIFFNAYEENALFVFGNTIGYMTEVNKETSGEKENSSTPKFKYKEDGEIVYFYNGLSGLEPEIAFARKIGETDEMYLARYMELDPDQQIMGFQMQVCLNYISPAGSMCALFYSWDFNDAEPTNSIPFFYQEPSLNITDQTTESFTTLSAWTHIGESLGTLGEFSNDITIDHFGNMLIVRDFNTHSTYYFVFSDSSYALYGSVGATKVSFNVDVKESIHSPKMIDLPMYYKAPNVSASDGSLDGRMFLGAAEPIAPLNGLNADNNLLITNSDNYFRGELALFVVARAKDGTEIYRTPPQIFRNETLLNDDRDVFVFIPTEEGGEKEITTVEGGITALATYPALQYYPYYYLVWDRMYLNEAFFLGANDNAYKRYQTWKDKYGRYDKHIKPFIESVSTGDLYKLQIEIDAEGQNIHELVIYSTRLYPLFKIEGETFRTNNIDVLNEPFYQMKVLNGNEKSYTITYQDLKNIETKTDAIYTPTQSGETSFFAKQGIEYNNSYHSFGIEELQPSISSSELRGSSDSRFPNIVTTRTYDGAIYYANYRANDVLEGTWNGFAPEQSYLISFPLALRDVFFGKVEGNTMTAYGKFTPKYSSFLNCSYIVDQEEETYDSDVAGFVRPNIYWTSESYQKFVKNMQTASRNSRKFKQIVLDNLDNAEQVVLNSQYPIKVGNRMQVSDTNNPISNPYKNSYRIGSLNNEIIALNSGAIEMSDAKFGEFPLYVFTKEGIFAMQTGKETLYSSVVPINYDVIINPHTLAVNGSVLYFTEKGLHALTNQGVKLLSSPIHTIENRIPDWMFTSQMVYLPEWNEVLCVDLPDKKAYVFSLDSNVWSTRDIPEGYLLNNCELVSGKDIYNLHEEDSSLSESMAFSLITRPIKLGSMELKRAETIIVRFESPTSQSLRIVVKGSIDTQTWGNLYTLNNVSTNKDIILRRTPCSVKYLQFIIEGAATSDIRILAFELEYYERMRHRMR